MSRRLWLVIGASAALLVVPFGAFMVGQPSHGVPARTHSTWSGAPSSPAHAYLAQSKAFDEATAVEIARDEFRVEQRDASGLTKVEISSQPTSVFKDGQWVAATAELTRTESGSLIADYAIMPVELAQNSSEGDLIRLESSTEATLSIDIVGSTRAEASVDLKDSTRTEVTYAGAVGGNDLVVTVTPNSLYQAVLLERAPESAPVYVWRLSAPGLALVDAEGGGFALLDSDGDLAFTINPPLMWDSRAGGEVGDAATMPVEFDIAESEPGEWLVTLKPELDWLQSPERVYPVFVDPEVSTSGTVSSYKNTPNQWQTVQSTTPRVGFTQESSTCCLWRTMFRFPGYDAYFGKRLTSVGVSTYWTFGSTSTKSASFWTASKFAFDGNYQKYADFTIGTQGLATGPSMYQLFSNIMNNSDPYTYFMLVGDEGSGYSRKDLNVVLAFFYVEKPTVGNPLAPTPVSTASDTVNVYANDVVMTSTGTNYFQGTTQLFRYVFTSSNGGTPWTSGWMTGEPYRIPDTVLTPGKNYSYSIQTTDNADAAPIVTRSDSNWRFHVQAPPTVVAGSVKVDSTVLAGTATAAYESSSARPTLSATVTDPEGGSVWAVFTVKRDGVVILDSLQGSRSPSNLAAGGQFVSTVQLPYALDPAGSYTVEVQGFDGVLASAAVSPAQQFKVALSGLYKEIPGLNDQETVVAP